MEDIAGHQTQISSTTCTWCWWSWRGWGLWLLFGSMIRFYVSSVHGTFLILSFGLLSIIYVIVIIIGRKLKVYPVTFLTSTLNQSTQVLKWLEWVHSSISMTAKLGVINSQFYRFLRLCSCKKFFVFQMVSLIVFLKAKGYPFKVLLKRTRGLDLKEKFLFGISAFGIFRMILLRVM